MTIKFMIIDGQSDFRKLLSHHLSVHWPDAIIAEFDPTVAGHLPTEFSGAGNDMILLGNQLGDRGGTQVLKQFLRTQGFLAVVYFGAAEEEVTVARLGADGFFLRDDVRHKQLIIRLTDVLNS
ncbi:MAG: hypothetical protein O2907_07850 [Proteobacteria bacterium]|nr:hypothetical protein [Pseudomonadota bacterium]MDA1064225.1 hypothetical protein [Pseudomonadota bacterium]